MSEPTPEARSFRWLLYAVAVPAGLVGTVLFVFMTSLSAGWPFHEAEALHLIHRGTCHSRCEGEDAPDCRRECDCFTDTLRRDRSDDEYAALILGGDTDEKALAFEEATGACAAAPEPEPSP